MGGETRRPTLEVESRKIRCKVKGNNFSAKASDRLCMARNSPFLNTLCSVLRFLLCFGHVTQAHLRFNRGVSGDPTRGRSATF